MRKQLNCPNCGGPITQEQCPYCGTMFYDFSAIEIGKPCYIKIKHNSQLILVKAIANNVECRMYADTYDCVDDLGNIMYSFPANRNIDFSMDFHCVPFDDHLMEVRQI